MDDPDLIERLLSRREKQIQQLGKCQGRIAALEAAILRYRPAFDFPPIEQIISPRQSLPPKPRPRTSIRLHPFKPGDLLKLSLAALKELGRAAYTSEIAQIVTRDSRFDGATLPAVTLRLYTPLRKAAAAGYVERLRGDDDVSQWRLAPTSREYARTISFKTGEAMRLTLEALRELGRPASASEIANILAEKKGFDGNKLCLINIALGGVFRTGLKVGLITRAHHDAGGVRWALGATSVVPTPVTRLKRGEARNLILSSLAKIDGPAHIKQISEIIAKKKKMDAEQRLAVEKSLYGTLCRAVKDKVLKRASNDDLGARWQLASPSNSAPSETISACGEEKPSVSAATHASTRNANEGSVIL